MITFKSLRFLSPDGDAGGGTAVADPPAKAAEPAFEPIGKGYTAALDKLRGEIEAPAATGPKAGPTGAKGPDDPGSTAATGPAATGATGVAAPAKPTSALDAALDSAVTGPTGVKADGEPESILKDIPEILPKEGRKDHWERARGAISKLETTVSGYVKTNAELRKELETAKATPPEASARVTELEKENADLRDAIVGINVEYSPDHRKKFIEGRTSLVAKAASKLNAFGGKGELITEALAMAEGRGRTQAIKEALAELEPVEQNRVLQFVTEVEKLDDEKAEIMKDPQGAWARLQESEKARSQATAKQREDNKNAIFEKTAAELPKSHFLLRTVDPSIAGAEEHNAGVKAMREGALALLRSDAKPEELVEAAFAKQELPRLQELLLSTRKELTTVHAALKEFEGASPGFRGGKPPEKSSLEQQLEKTPGQLYRESFDKQKGRE